jgi:hypothetical protein
VITQQDGFYSENQEGVSVVPIMEAVGHREPHDTNPIESKRKALKGLARTLGMWLSSRELVYLAGAVEVEANLARAVEEAGGQ